MESVAWYASLIGCFRLLQLGANTGSKEEHNRTLSLVKFSLFSFWVELKTKQTPNLNWKSREYMYDFLLV